MQQEAKEVYVHPELLKYVQSICEATRHDKNIRVGVSVRGALSLVHAVKAYALVCGRDYVVPEDIKRLAVAVLAHRIILEGRRNNKAESEHVVEAILREVEVPTEDWRK